MQGATAVARHSVRERRCARLLRTCLSIILVSRCERGALAAQAGESLLVVGVEQASAAAAAATAATGITTGIATSVTASLAASIAAVIATGIATTAAEVSPGAATATAARAAPSRFAAATAAAATEGIPPTATTASAAATPGALRFDIALVNLDELLGFTLTLFLGLGANRGDEILVLVLDQGLGSSPLLVGLDALVGLANLEFGLERQLLLCQLGQVVGVGDMLVFGLLRDLVFGFLGFLGLLGFLGVVFGGSLLLVLLGNVLAGLLVLQLGFAFDSMASLLFRSTTGMVSESTEAERGGGRRPGRWPLAVPVIAIAGEPSAAAFRPS